MQNNNSGNSEENDVCGIDSRILNEMWKMIGSPCGEHEFDKGVIIYGMSWCWCLYSIYS